MTFILTEKPSVAKAFAHALAVPFTGSYYENSRYLITNCLGHLFQAFDPEDYEVHYKKWSLSDLPIIPHTIRFKKIEASKKQANLVVSLLQAHRSDTIIIATDAGREGELIARIVLSEAGISGTKNIFRFWTSSALTPSVITETLKRVKPLSDYLPSFITSCKNAPFGRKSADSRTRRNIQAGKGNRRVYPNSLL